MIEKLENWNINDNIFLWEERNPARSDTEIFLLKLYEDREPILLQI